MPIVVGIDGTGGGFTPGDTFNKQYDIDFDKSFVKKICGNGSSNKMYFRGPVALGGGLPEAIEGGYNFILSKLQQAQFGALKKPQFQGTSNPIFNLQFEKSRIIPNNLNTQHEAVLLTGYSRGGLGVLVIAEKLRLKNIPVAGMVLFDAVDRHLAFDAPSIPENVAEVVHVMRHPSTDSRPSFGNCGTEFTHKTKYTERKFMCTHGGMGGTPWTQGKHNSNSLIDEGKPDPPDGVTRVTYGQDQLVSPQVWTFVLPFLQKHNFI